MNLSFTFDVGLMDLFLRDTIGKWDRSVHTLTFEWAQEDILEECRVNVRQKKKIA